MKKVIAVFAAILLFAGLILSLFFLTPHPPHTWANRLIGWGMVGAGLLILYLLKKQKESTTAADNRAVISELKNNGEKIRVDLRECEVKSNSWTEIVDKNDKTPDAVLLTAAVLGGTGGMMGIALRSYNSEKSVKRLQSVIVFRRNNETFCSPILDREEATLRMLMEMKGETVIYRDRVKKELFYFDLEFLEN